MAELFGDRYELIHTLGLGGIGEVWLAKDAETGEEVVIKRLLTHPLLDDPFAQRYLQEARTVAGLPHSKLAPILAVIDDPPAIVMAHFPRGSLAEHLAIEALDGDDVLALLTGIGAALESIHAAGRLHGAVKPTNVLIANNGKPCLADFGLAVGDNDRVTAITMTAMMMNAAAYLPPEADEPATMDARSDLYSLGVTAYHAATEQIPFTGPTPARILRHHRESPRPDPRTLAPDLNDDLAAVIITLMQSNPDHRYQSATALLDDVWAVANPK